MKILIPELLKQKVEEISKHKHTFKFELDKALCLLNLIIYGYFGQDSIEDDWISLSSNIMQENVGRSYCRYLELFQKEGWIEKKNYSTDFRSGHCNLYRLTQQWSQKITAEKMDIYEYKITHLKLINKIKAKVMPSVIKKFSYLWKWYNHENFTLDIQEAKRELNQLELDKKKQYSILNSILNFEQNNKWFISHAKDKRLHTNLTNMKKDLRKYLRFNQEPLINIDIDNSQIFFLLTLLTKIKEYKKEDSIKGKEGKGGIYYIILELLDITICDKELQRFNKLVASGTFYKELGRQLINDKGEEEVYIKKKYDYKNKKLNSLVHTEPKKLMKPIVFEVLFSKNSQSSTEKAWFRKQFPTIYSVCEKIKEKKHNRLALTLQKIEAEAILFKTAKRIANFNKEIPIFTIHDSILTTPEHVETVKEIMEKSIEEFTGLKPSITIDWEEHELKKAV